LNDRKEIIVNRIDHPDPNRGESYGAATDACRKDLRHDHPLDRSDGEGKERHESTEQCDKKQGAFLLRAENQGQAEQAKNAADSAHQQQRAATQLVDIEECDHGENHVHKSNDGQPAECLAKLNSRLIQNRGTVVEHHGDAAEFGKHREKQRDEKRLARAGAKKLGELPGFMAERATDFTHHLSRLGNSVDTTEDGQSLGLPALADEITRGFRNEQAQAQE